MPSRNDALEAARPARARFALALAAAALLGSPPASPAQEPPPAGPPPADHVPERLTLERALEIARQRNPTYRKTMNRVRSAAAAERSRWGALLPRLQTSLSMGGFSSRTVTGEDDFGEPRALPEAVEYEGSNTSQRVSMSMTLFDGFAGWNGLEAARAATDAASAGRAQEALRLDAEVKRAFYDALGAARMIELEERMLAAARERLATTRELLRVARTRPEDVLGAEVDVARQQQELEAARGEARKAKLRLLQAMGVEDAAEFVLEGRLGDAVDPGRLEADVLVERALAGSPRIRAARAEVDRAANAADAARAERWPRISLSAGLSRGMNVGSYEALTMLNPQNRSLSFGLSASLPLFTGFETSRRIAEAEASQSNAREDLRAARLDVERLVREALIDVENAYRSLELAEHAAELSRRRLEMAQERYQLGETSFTELQQLIERTAREERGAIQARLVYARALATLEERVGGGVQP